MGRTRQRRSSTHDTAGPYLTFRHGDRSVDFLKSILGFEEITAQRGADGTVVHAELRLRDAMVMGGSGVNEPGGSPGLYLVVDDVDRIYELAIAAGAVSVYPPEDTEWGSRRARFRDLDGHEWTVGTYQPGAPDW